MTPISKSQLAPRRLIRTALPYQLTGAIDIQLTVTMTTTRYELVFLTRFALVTKP